MEVCHLKALPLTGEIIAGMPRSTAVKRTSLKLRNPANAPDEYEQRALYARLVLPSIERAGFGQRRVTMPSPSPAHAGMSYAEKLRRWARELPES